MAAAPTASAPTAPTHAAPTPHRPPMAAPDLTRPGRRLTSSTPAIPTRPTPRSPRSAADIRAAVVRRLPELLGGAGAMLVVAAVAGFVVSSWDILGSVGQAGLLAAGSAGLSAQASWAQRTGNGVLRRLVPLSWGAAAGLTLAAAQLLLDLAVPDLARLAVLGAGLAALGHAGWAWHRHRDSIVLQLATVTAAVYAVGPAGSSMAAGWDQVRWDQWVLGPFEALVTGATTNGSDALVWVAVGHAVVAIAWIAAGLRLDHPAAARVARVGGTTLLGWAVLECNAMAAPIGAAIALLLVIGVLIVGIAIEDAVLIGLGVLAGLVTGLRTVWSLFTGEVAVTITIAVAGVAMVATAVQVARRRGGDQDAAPQ